MTSPPYFGLRDYGHLGQIGLEGTLGEYIARIVGVFRAVRRVLRDDGTLWLNLGDSYSANQKGSDGYRDGRTQHVLNIRRGAGCVPGFKRKDMLGVPWRVAFALQDDGWYLRQDIIWHKPNAMPESVRDRCTKAHEYVFHFAKSERYLYDAAAVAEPVTGGAHHRGTGVNPKARTEGRYSDDGPAGERDGFRRHRGLNDPRVSGRAPRSKKNASYSRAINGLVESRNRRSVWTIPTQPYSGAHFAAFPEALVEPCILAGSRRGDLVLDPFAGSGTVGAVAIRLGRAFVGAEINPTYRQLALERIAAAEGVGPTVRTCPDSGASVVQRGLFEATGRAV